MERILASLPPDGRVAVVRLRSLGDCVLTTPALDILKRFRPDLRIAVVVEDRYSAVFRLERVRPAVVADMVGECQVRWPTVPIVFCESRKLAQEWTYRFLAAAWAGAEEERVGSEAVARLVPASPLAPAPPTAAEVRAWALERGLAVSPRGRVPQELVSAFLADRDR